MNIGTAVEQSGLPPKTIRYYQEIGLLTADRAANGYRGGRIRGRDARLATLDGGETDGPTIGIQKNRALRGYIGRRARGLVSVSDAPKSRNSSMNRPRSSVRVPIPALWKMALSCAFTRSAFKPPPRLRGPR